MAQSMRDFGKTISIMVEENFTTPVVISMKVSSLTIWPKDLESIGMPMVANMSATGIKISSMDLEKRNGMMAASTKDFTKMPLRKVKESIAGQMEIGILESGKTIC